MFRNLITKISPNFWGNKEILRSIKLPLITPTSFQCSLTTNETVEKWIKTLPEDKQKRVKHIQNEIALKTAEMKKMPRLDTINVKDYEEMVEMTSSRRQRYYEYLHSSRTARVNDDVKKLIRQKVYEEKKKMGMLGRDLNSADSKPGHIDYGLGKSALIMKVTRKTMMSWRNQKLYRMMMINEQPLLFDCGFCDTMSKFEIRDTARQIKYAFSENRLHSRPFVMHLCNMDEKSLLWRELERQMPNFPKLPLKVHTGDVTEVFPKQELVYLSPDAEDVMHEFNANDNYIIGSIVDKGQQMPLTLAKAKKLNIRTVRLPLNKYIKFHSHKTLTLDQMVNILLELKKSRDWPKALKHVPRRKIFG